MKPASKALGGVPIRVPSPPMLAAYAMPSSKATSNVPTFAPTASTPPRDRAMTDVAIGNIITTVAVLLTHMLMNAVPAMNPHMRFAGRVPTTARMDSARRRCSPQLSSAIARRNPPRKR